MRGQDCPETKTREHQAPQITYLEMKDKTMFDARNENALITNLNIIGVVVAYGMLGISLWLSTEVPLATKGYWGMGILLLTLSLINVVKYRFDIRQSSDRIRRIEEVRNERMLEEALKEPSSDS